MNAWVYLLLVQGNASPEPALPPPDQFGSVLAIVGDQNADGCPEIVVADPGSVWLLSGKVGAVLWRIQGTPERRQLGRGLATVRGEDGVERVAVLSGRRDEKARITLHSAADGRESTAKDVHDHAITLAGIGDVDGDGVSDLVLGVSTAPRPNGPSWGQCQILSGSTLEVLAETPRGSFGRGRYVSTGPDMDGDGVPDFLAESNLFSGADGRLLRSFEMTHDEPYFGRGGAFLGDLDGDGCADVAISAEGSYTLNRAGDATDTGARVTLFSGKSRRELLSVTGTSYDLFGSSVAGLDDLDADGVPDFAVGGNGSSWKGQVWFFSGKSGEQIHQVSGPPGLGHAIEILGDVDGDGVRDLVVASHRLFLTRNGGLHVYSVAKRRLLYSVDRQTLRGSPK